MQIIEPKKLKKKKQLAILKDNQCISAMGTMELLLVLRKFNVKVRLKNQYCQWMLDTRKQ